MIKRCLIDLARGHRDGEPMVSDVHPAPFKADT